MNELDNTKTKGKMKLKYTQLILAYAVLTLTIDNVGQHLRAGVLHPPIGYDERGRPNPPAPVYVNTLPSGADGSWNTPHYIARESHADAPAPGSNGVQTQNADGAPQWWNRFCEWLGSLGWCSQ